jgi:hypothetical protein
MDYRRPNTFTGIENIERYNKIVQEERLFNFLNGLSDRLDQMRAHILQTSPLSITEQAFAWVKREEVRQNLMVGKDEMSAAVMYAGTKPTLKSPSEMLPSNQKSDRKNHLKCTHCGGTRHTKDTCFEIHGYPEWWKEGKKKTGGYNRARPSVNMIQSNRTTETAGITEPGLKFSEEKQGEAAAGANQQQHVFFPNTSGLQPYSSK